MLLQANSVALTPSHKLRRDFIKHSIIHASLNVRWLYELNPSCDVGLGAPNVGFYLINPWRNMVKPSRQVVFINRVHVSCL